MDLRSLQKPLKEQYRADPNASRITIRAKGAQTGAPIACSVDIGRAIHQAEAHKGVGGAGAGACSGDLLLGALAACAQITCQMVAAAMSIPTERIEVTVEGDLDLRGTLGISKEVSKCPLQTLPAITSTVAPINFLTRLLAHPEITTIFSRPNMSQIGLAFLLPG